MKTNLYQKVSSYKNCCKFEILFLFVFILSLHRSASAQNFHLVKDINTSTDSSPANYIDEPSSHDKRNEYAVLNGAVYFSADDGVHGRGLWRSDGTTTGTYQLKEGVSPTNITSSNGKIYFAGIGNTGLWKSDGTRTGTVQVLNKVPNGMYFFNPYGLADFNGTLFFIITSRYTYDQLWKTDGTSNGTILVKDFYSPQDTSFAYLTDLTVIKNKLYFSAYTLSTSASRLFVSNGTASGTHIVSHSLTNPAQMIAGSPNSQDSSVYFTASTEPDQGRKLYVTKGDSAEPVVTPGFNGFINYYRESLLNVGGLMYFIGYRESFPKTNSLYKFDINSGDGIQPVKVVSERDNFGRYSEVSSLTYIDGTLYFTIDDRVNSKRQLWKSDGSSQGNVLLKDSLSAYNFTKVNGRVFFSAYDHIHGLELWKTDGTANGTVIVKDINAGKHYSSTSYLTYFDGRLLFQADDGVHGNELWQSDGTSMGTSLLKDINQTSTSSSSPYGLTSVNNQLLFTANSVRNERGALLWKSDGTNSGTIPINDTVYADYIFNDTFVTHKNQTYFFGNSASGRIGIYKTDGSSTGTSMVEDFTGTLITPSKSVCVDSLIYFYLINSDTNTYELWKTDGTEASTLLIKKFPATSYAATFMAIGNTLYFVISYDHSLWRSDGTEAGTVMLKTFARDPSELTAHDGVLFFSAFEDSASALWKSNGTPGGTFKVTGNVIDPVTLISYKDQLYFTGAANASFYGNADIGLFRTNGTESGTVLVKNVLPGNTYSYTVLPIIVGGTLYFFASNHADGNTQIWRSNGTAPGTFAVSNVGSVKYNVPAKAISCNGKLCFFMPDGLWESDGTQAGTQAVKDEIFSQITVGASMTRFTSAGNQLFFVGENYQYGEELYGGTISSPVVINYITAGDGNWDDPATWTGKVVPPAAASVTIHHKVDVNINVICNNLKLEPSGHLTINHGSILTVLE